MSEVRLKAAQIWMSVVGSLLLAALVLVFAVLPAEFDLDPTGFGEWVGIRGMSGYQVQALSVEQQGFRRDSVQFELAPFESVEYKYSLAAGQAMVFSWRSDGEVVFDFHSEQAEKPPEEAVSFALGRSRAQHGTYVAPFDGIHGWFWENRGDDTTTVELSAEGFFSKATTFSRAGAYERVLNEPHPG